MPPRKASSDWSGRGRRPRGVWRRQFQNLDRKLLPSRRIPLWEAGWEWGSGRLETHSFILSLQYLSCLLCTKRHGARHWEAEKKEDGSLPGGEGEEVGLSTKTNSCNPVRMRSMPTPFYRENQKRRSYEMK